MWKVAGRTVFAGALLLGCPLELSAAGSAADAPEHDLRFSLMTSKPGYALYEPVILTLRLSNEGSHRVSMDGSLVISIGYATVWITDPDGVRQRYNSGLFLDVVGSRIDLEPGEAEEFREVVSWNGMTRQLAFPAVGMYDVDALLRVVVAEKGVSLEAKSLTVKIDEASSADTRFAEGVGSTADLVELLTETPSKYCKGKPATTCFEQLRSLVREIPESAYAPFVLYYLAEIVESDILLVTPKSAVVVESYEEVLKRWPNHGLRLGALEHLGMALTQAGRRDEAEEYFRKAESEFPATRRSIRKFKEDFERGDD